MSYYDYNVPSVIYETQKKSIGIPWALIHHIADIENRQAFQENICDPEHEQGATRKLKAHGCGIDMASDSIALCKQDKIIGMASNPLRRLWRRPSPPPPFKEDSVDEDDVLSEFPAEDEHFEKSDSDETDTMNQSMALMDLTEKSFAIPRRHASTFGRKNRSTKRETKPVRSILRNGSGLTYAPKKSAPRECKRLTFALSPTFISEAKLRQAVPDSIANDSVLSLDGDEIFDTDDLNAQEASMKLGDSSDERPTRRSSMTQFKAKSSLGFDERFVGFSESNMGSFGNFSYSSI